VCENPRHFGRGELDIELPVLAPRIYRQYSLTDRCGSGRRPVLQDVDVHVIGVRRIGPWPEHRRESPACGDADGIDRGTQMLISNWA
jgi:hypothetical protein